MNSVFACFGYGSLVNHSTRRPRQSRTIDCRLKGWRREWRAVSTLAGPGHCALSIRPEGHSEIDGVLVVEPIHLLPALDRREAQYDRLTVNRLDLRLHRSDPLDPHINGQIVTYRAERPYRQWGCERAPVTQSYVDTVLHGFLKRFGEAGVQRFMATTDGWDIVPIIDDRDEPLYARAARITRDEAGYFDAVIRQWSGRRKRRAS